MGVDVSQVVSTASFICLKNVGYEFVVARGFDANGTLRQNVTQTLKNAIIAGLKTDIYMLVCRGKNASSQVD
jgi:hypothetical protein